MPSSSTPTISFFSGEQLPPSFLLSLSLFPCFQPSPSPFFSFSFLLFPPAAQDPFPAGPSPRPGPNRRRPLPQPTDRRGPPVGVVSPATNGLPRSPAAARPAPPRGLARTPRQPQPPLFKRRDLPWNPIDRKPPPLARANPSRHCCRAQSSAPRRRFAAQPRRIRRSEGSPRGEDRPPPRNPSLSRVLGLGKAHRSLSSAGCRCAPCSGRLDPLPSIPSSL